jgi:diadenosine tetraphosphatase ApaH/serine/threonine PP2A family protein phosphatase
VPLTAVISDIHANLEALEAVLADCVRRGIVDVLCLGDIVGYGPDPGECVDLVRSRCVKAIRGNHDEALVQGPVGFTPMARDAILWTRKVLRPRFWRPGSAARWRFLENLPLEDVWGEYLLVHGSPRDPTSEYIMERDILMGDRRKFPEIFERFDSVCLVGHTHIPGVFLAGPRFVPQRELTAPFRFEEKMVINVGSVGQPRDRDPRACYLTFDQEQATFEFHRLDYDREKTRQKISAVAALNAQLGDRLLEGV